MSVLMSDDFILDAEQYDEFKMWQGLIGPYYYPSVDGAGNLSWTNNGGLSNPAVVNIQGRGLTIVGIVEDVSDLPETADDYVTYLVGDEAPYNGYIYDNGNWVDLGLVGASAGFGTPTATIDSSTGTPAVTITASGPDTAKVFAFAFSNLKGANGQDGVGVPTGGTTGQVLKKASSTDYDTEWGSVEALPTGGTTGQALVKHSNSNYDVEWADVGGGDVQTVNSVQPDANGNVQITADDIGTDANGISVQDAIDDAVHVGTSAPTDPTCKIWLDTDEPGMSAVSSVNGHSGTVVLDPDDVGAMWKWELLWTNASPASSFSAQTVAIDLTNYDFVAVFAMWSKTYQQICPLNLVYIGAVDALLIGLQSNSAASLERLFSVSTSGVTFGTGKLGGSNNNDMLIPFRIYGIKGLVTS